LAAAGGVQRDRFKTALRAFRPAGLGYQWSGINTYRRRSPPFGRISMPRTNNDSASVVRVPIAINRLRNINVTMTVGRSAEEKPETFPAGVIRTPEVRAIIIVTKLT
jgi:hypothetical protein